MLFKFLDGTIKKVTYDPNMAARLIHRHQQDGVADFKVEIDPELPEKEQKKQLAEIQHYLDHYRNQAGR